MSGGDVDGDGRPILVEVAVPGDEARRRGLRLEVDDGQGPKPAPAAQDSQAGLEQYLRERIEQAVRQALPQATEQTLERLRRERRWDRDD